MRLKFACLFFSGLLLVICGCRQQSKPTIQEQASAPKTTTVSLCDDLNTQIQKINNQSDLAALEKINQNIQHCLPQLSFEDKKQLIYATTNMYQRFLATNRTPEQQAAFEQYAINNSINPAFRQNYLANFNPRDRYLIEHQGEAFYELYDIGDGTIIYRRQPNYLLKLFAPSLPEAERVFIENLAQQNQLSIISNGNLDLSWSEISRRAQFWQDYIQHYPNSSFIDDAQRLKFKYSQFLFHGTRNFPVSTSYLNESDIYPEALNEIKLLAQQSPSALGKQAQKFLEFTTLTTSQRDQQIPYELSPAEQRSEQSRMIKTNRQLDLYMRLFDPLALDGTHIARDCLIDAICITHTGKVTNSLIGPTQY
ncbi:hypothetical protein [Acinetobacter sp. MD2(2019)]|uniref:hypothetical protein n=1 Tax=Acinetobacter sp. MD2(2019) TaxID=2605273 RepID=UPI002D1F4048|nr:hypothetical protein [Acinetobacter sp. MD2(2019)]MEB3755026.1 hypothetical protein [Acinetobacter sp. MD2(2019)]